MPRFPALLVGVALDARDRFLLQTCVGAVGPLGVRRVVLAHVRRLDPPLTLLGVDEPERPDPGEVLATLATTLRARLPGCAVGTARGLGSPAEELLAIAERENADILLLGRLSGPPGRPDQGLDGRAILRHAACTTLVVPEGAALSLDHALVGVDLSPESLRALQAAAGLFRRVSPLFCLPPEDDDDDAAREARRQAARERFAREALPTLPAGACVDELRVPECAEPAEALLAALGEIGARAIVLGGLSRTRLAAALLGSTAERVAREAPAPVLVVRDRHARRGLLRSLVGR